MPPRAHRFRPAVLVGALLLALTVAVFAQLGTHPFSGYDDNAYVVDNPVVRSGLSVRGIAWAFATLHAANWHPLTWLSHMLDVQLFGLAPGAHHLVSLAFHAANTVLLFVALRALTGALWPPALVAALFGVHPLHVESVAWLAERKDVLSTLFFALTLLAWARYARRPGPARYGAAAAPFALGLLAKPMLVTLPFVLLLLDLWPLGRLARGVPPARAAGRLLLEKAPLLALSAASSWVTLTAQRSGAALVPLQVIPLDDRIANALVSWMRYVGKAVWPGGLSPIYPYAAPPARLAAASGIAIAALTVAALLAWRRRPHLAVGWLWYLGTLVPVIGLVQVGGQAMADRYTYVPLIGLAIAAAWAVAGVAAARPRLAAPLVAGAVAAVAALAVAALLQVGHWRDDRSLFASAVAATGSNWMAEMNLGVALSAQGRHAEAIARYETARRLMPLNADVHYNLGVSRAALRDYRGAIEDYARAAALRPGDADTQNNLGAALMALGRTEEALARYREAARLDPGDAVALGNVAAALRALGRASEAAAAAEAARRAEARRGAP